MFFSHFGSRLPLFTATDSTFLEMRQHQRLSTLLSTFRLPGEASTIELKEAYFREAKRLHPDCNPEAGPVSASRQFAELQARFEEASQLMRKRDTFKSIPGSSTWEPPWRSMHQTTADASAMYAERPPVPVVGLPASVVYTCSALVSGAVFTILWPGQSKKGSAQKDSVTSAPKERHVVAVPSHVPGKTSEGDSIQQDSKEAVIFRDASAYLNTTSKFRRTASRQDKPGRIEYQLRDGVDLTPVQVAAEDGNVWFLDRCGASRMCSGMLNLGDRRGDTPLHKCAMKGQTLACRTLLRIGANPSAENKWHLRPQDLAAHNGNSELVELLLASQLGSRGLKKHIDLEPAYWDVRRHPDGLGSLIGRLPKGMSYFGPYHSATLRNAVNNAAGQDIIADVILSGESQAELQAASQSGTTDVGSEFALNRVRRTLKGSGFELENNRVRPEALAPGAEGWMHENGAKVLGLLMFEPAGAVTTDAPGHWFGLRCMPAGLLEEDGVRKDVFRIFRLDPVRGAFEVDHDDFAELLKRYPAWRLVRQQSTYSKLFQWSSLESRYGKRASPYM